MVVIWFSGSGFFSTGITAAVVQRLGIVVVP